MAGTRRITRDQLAQFLPNHETIKTFEQLFEYVTETLPTILLEIQYVEMAVNGRETSGTTNRINELEAIQPRSPNKSQEANRINDLELMQPRRSNIHELENRIAELEAQLARRENNGAILRRLEDLEKLVGV